MWRIIKRGSYSEMISFRLQLISLIFAFLAANLIAQERTPNILPDDQRLQAVQQALSATRVQIQSIPIVETSPGQLLVWILVEGETWTLSLHKSSIRSLDFRVLVQRDLFGALVEVTPPPVATYRGTVLAHPESRVSATVHEGSITAMIKTIDGLIGIQPLTSLGLSARVSEHVIYRAADVFDGGQYTCGVTVDHLIESAQDSNDSGSLAGTGLSVIDLAIDSDVEFYNKNGQSVDNTIRDIEGVMDIVEFIYERDVAISYEITAVIVRTVEPDPYSSTDPEALLCALRTTWNQAPHTSIRRDTTHLFTGKNVDSNVIGIAFVGVVCNVQGRFSGCAGGRDDLAYGVSESRFTTSISRRTALTAHELGHNWGASHCNGGSCHIMCDMLGGCGGVTGSNLKFGPTASSEIINHRNSRSCLTNLSPPLTLPFEESFPSTTLDTSKWNYHVGVEVTSNASQEPSPSFSMTLNAAGSQEFLDDEIRSQVIQLGSSFGVFLFYATQHQGVPAGGALVVEYWSDTLIWKKIARFISDGVDQTIFISRNYQLPSDALHDEFRLRFRAEVDGPGENWFIDDILIDRGCVVDLQCADLNFCNGVEVCVSGECFAGVSPCQEGESCEETLDLCFDASCPPPTAIASGGRYLLIEPPMSLDSLGFVIYPVCDEQLEMYATAPDQNALALLTQDFTQAAFLTSANWGSALGLTGRWVVPSTDYMVHSLCGSVEAPTFSAPITVSTARWGDVVGEFDGISWTLPDGRVDIIDAAAIIDAFRNLPTAPELYRADLIANSFDLCTPDRKIDIVDVVSSLDGFRSSSFAATWSCSVPCP